MASLSFHVSSTLERVCIGVHYGTLSAGSDVNLTIFGTDLSNETVIRFTSNSESCDVSDLADLFGGGTLENVDTAQNGTLGVQIAHLLVNIPVSSAKTVYFCVFDDRSLSLIHQSSVPWLAMVVQPSFLPLSVEIIFIIVLMVLSGLFSGLNLGLMSLDPTTLKIITESGSSRQRIYAKLIYRVRRHGNYLLCTLLLGNVLVNSTLTILLDEVLPSGIYAVIASTLAIVIFGEIIPQAICSRHGLVVGAWTIPFTILFMIVTFPLSLPLSLILHVVLGKEIGSVYNRDQLLKLLHVTKEHHDLENDEVDVISGVLGYKKKLAKDVMTNFEDVFCISIDSVLDFKTMREIYNSGFSRIPVYEDTKENIVHLLYVRDLAFVDADDKTALASHVQFYKHDMLFFYDDTPLDEILKGFLDGKCHLGVIQTIREVPNKDPEYAAVGEWGEGDRNLLVRGFQVQGVATGL
jgi:metal transporter CNNM